MIEHRDDGARLIARTDRRNGRARIGLTGREGVVSWTPSIHPARGARRFRSRLPVTMRPGRRPGAAQPIDAEDRMSRRVHRETIPDEFLPPPASLALAAADDVPPGRDSPEDDDERKAR